MPHVLLDEADRTELCAKVDRLIRKSAARDHLNRHAPGLPDIVSEHFHRTAEAILHSELEIYCADPEAGKKMMLNNYRHAGEVASRHGLTGELHNQKKLDRAVAVAQRYLLAIMSPQPKTEEPICYLTNSRKRISGEVLVDYFIHDILRDAYELVFQHLGIVPPNRKPPSAAAAR